MRHYRDTNASLSSCLFSQLTKLHFIATATRHGFTAAKKRKQKQQKTSQVCSPVMQFSSLRRRSFTHKLGLLKALIDKTFTSHKQQLTWMAQRFITPFKLKSIVLLSFYGRTQSLISLLKMHFQFSFHLNIRTRSLRHKAGWNTPHSLWGIYRN